MFIRSFKPLLIVATVVGTGAWLVSFGWSNVRTDRRIDQHSAVVEGRVIDGATRALSKGGQISELTVEYTPERHATITRNFAVDGTDYRSARDTGNLTVTYWPKDPRVPGWCGSPRCPIRSSSGLAA